MAMLRSERGAVMVIAAIFMVTLFASMAIVADVGQLFLTQKRLQAAADAAALAGCFILIDKQDPTQADAESQKYVNVNISEPFQYSSSPNLANNTFQVNLSQNVHFYFAPVIGINSSAVSTSATAAGNTVISITGVVPLGVVKQEFEFNKPYTLKYDGGNGKSGNYGALALGGSGGSNYRTNLMYGYKEEIKIGDVLGTEPGNKAGPTDQGVNYRVSLDHSDLSHIAPNSPRVVIVPVIDGIVGNGRNGTATVLGFAAFYLEASNSNGDVTGEFIKWAVSGKTGDGSSFGLASPTLIK
jgi:Flp pilus assembly protein TadG